MEQKPGPQFFGICRESLRRLTTDQIGAVVYHKRKAEKHEI